MNRRERLIASVIGPEMDPEKAAFLDTTIKFILADQGEQYLKFWKLKGPGVMRLIPTQQKDAWCTLEDLRDDIRLCESLNNDDLGESLKRILKCHPWGGEGVDLVPEKPFLWASKAFDKSKRKNGLEKT